MQAQTAKFTMPWTTMILVTMAIFALAMVGIHPENGHAAKILTLTGFVLAVPLLAKAIPSIPSLKLVIMTASVMILDDPTGYPYYEITPFTETIGKVLFLPARRFSEIPIPFSLVEILAVFFAFQSISQHYRAEASHRAPVFTTHNAVAFLILAGWGLALCVIRGQDLADAMFQARSLPLYALVGISAPLFIKSEDDLWTFMKLLSICSVIKAIQGIYIWQADFGGMESSRRYLIDHYYSDALIHTGLFLIGSLLIPSNRHLALRVAGRVLCLTPVLIALILNNRRTAYIGAALSLAFLPFFIAPAFTRRHLIKIAGLAWIALGLFALIVLRKFNGASGHVYISDMSALYRVNENLNLLELVKYFPFSGAGFGIGMPLTHELASLGSFYKEFRLIPHNSLFFVWAFLGPIGLTIIAIYGASGISCGMALAEGKKSSDRSSVVKRAIMGFLVTSQILRWLIYVYSDMGLVESRFSLVVPMMVAGTAAILRRADRDPDENQHPEAPRGLD